MTRIDEAAFRSITDGFRPSLPMNGEQVFVDLAAGDEFKAGLFRLYADTLAAAGIVLDPADEADEKVVAMLTDSFENHLAGPRSPIARDELVAVNGLGLFLGIKKSVYEGADMQCLDPSSNMFGRLEGICHGMYPYSPNLPEALASSDPSARVAVVDRSGLTMLLRNVVICDAEGRGPIEARYAQAIVPLPEQCLNVYKTLPS